ncbi:MAG: PTS transporter subunit EIIA [Spirochaetales bacterium]|nr:PTS transporter subunit EIIA [Spirochaetales bacterium]
MTLESLLTPSLIFLGVPLSNKEQAIRFLLSQVVKRFGLGKNFEEFQKLVEERERLGGTTFPSRLFVPHARIPNFDDMIVALAVPREGFLSDGYEVRLVVLLLTSDSKPTIYLNTLSSFAKISMKKGVFEALLACKRPREVLRIVAAQHLQASAEPTLSEVVQHPAAVPQETPLRDAAETLMTSPDSGLVVVDSQGKPVGLLTPQAVLASGIPPSYRVLDHHGFLTRPGWFSDWSIGNDPVASAMSPLPTLPGALPWSLAALEFQKFAGPYAVLAADGTLEGIVHAKDLLAKFIWD